MLNTFKVVYIVYVRVKRTCETSEMYVRACACFTHEPVVILDMTVIGGNNKLLSNYLTLRTVFSPFGEKETK